MEMELDLSASKPRQAEEPVALQRGPRSARVLSGLAAPRVVACNRLPPTPRSLAPTNTLLLDSLLALLASESSSPLPLASLQLFLIEHTCHPDAAQRALVASVWRELLCFWWRDEVVVQTLQLLIETATATAHDAVRDDVLQIVAQVFPELPAAAQAECLAVVTQTVDAWLREGPSCRADATSTAHLCLLDLLDAASFLAHYDLPDKEEWIATFLRLAVECIGTALDQLSASSNGNSNASAKDPMVAGLLRVLDVGLLVVKAALLADTEEGRGRQRRRGQDDHQSGESKTAALVPCCYRWACEVVSRLAAIARQSPAVVDSLERLLRLTLDVLSQFCARAQAQSRQPVRAAREGPAGAAGRDAAAVGRRGRDRRVRRARAQATCW
ncbi:hypothetical protein PINS_up019684 [Pythium insidiosum]|nr:hypothetical protein PINS_up019684 [Pythium insidiosum]